MNFNVISEELFNKLAFKNSDLSSLVYSYYKFYLDTYLKEILNLQELNDKLQNNIVLDKINVYKQISYLNLDNVFLRNDIDFNKLTIEEFENYNNIYNNHDDNKMLEFIKLTFKKVITFKALYDKEKILEDKKLENSLIIGVYADLDENTQKYLKEKEDSFTKILGIPVEIVIYTVDNVYEVVNLNLENELRNKEILKKYPKYLPLGSVVLLKGGYKKVMIMGFAPVNMANKEETYDYIGCLYPEGVLKTDVNIVFNHDNIQQIFAIGLRDEEQKEFMKNIDKFLEKKIN